MLRLAQCEKAVTIPELMGYFRQGTAVLMGSKTPINLGSPVSASLDALACGSSCSCLSSGFYLVFNDLQAEQTRLRKGSGSYDHPVQEGNFVSIRGARFGPNFVTIQPTGVCVCSI
jgi:hypothetical protein